MTEALAWIVPALPLVCAVLLQATRTPAQADRLNLVTAVATAAVALVLSALLLARGGSAPLRGDLYLLDGAGGVFLGLTNCSEFAFQGFTTNRLFGPTLNPWDPSRTPGGSSGGAASAVAAGQRVAVLYRDAGVELRLAGVAAGAAPMGGRVQVRLDARRRVEGTVVAPGVVQLR